MQRYFSPIRNSTRSAATTAALCFAILLVTLQPVHATEANYFCPVEGINQPCASPPTDIPEFQASFIYRFIATDAQLPFDRFSWQAFIASNWPYDDNGLPLVDGLNQPYQGKLRWQAYPTQADLLQLASPDPCNTPDNTLTLTQFYQATDEVLVDTSGNYILYETRLNPVSRTYIENEGLATQEGRLMRAELGDDIEFPFQSELGPGSQLLKFAWKILTDADDANHYLVQPAMVAVAAKDSLDGQSKCLAVEVGLVGMHLVQRVRSGNGDRWIWSTFEHRLNAPLAGNARNPNSIMASKPFPEGCTAPATTNENAYSFYQLPDSPTNTYTAAIPLWNDLPPYAYDARGTAIPSANLVRCWQIFEGTRALNEHWHSALKGTVWKNYFLIGTQWIGNPGGEPFGIGEVPRFLTNVTLESFIQQDASGTCLGCHSNATTDAGQDANLTFVLNPTF